MSFDYVIVGAGPSGLALAQCLSKNNSSILIIDRESTIGGCHRVRRVKDPKTNQLLFTEHGPRIYSETYNVFKELLKEMNTDFFKLYKKYNFNILEIGGETIFSVLNFSEFCKLTFSFLNLLINESYGISTNLYEYLKVNHFSEKSINMIDKICKLTDGGGHKKFTLNEFLELFNQQFIYSLYQPILPNDIGLFNIWYDFLKSRKVQFLFNSTISDIHLNRNNTIESVSISRLGNTYTDIYTHITTNNLILAIPPKNIYNMLLSCHISNAFGLTDIEFYNFSNETAYLDYLSVTYHWDTDLFQDRSRVFSGLDTPGSLKKVYGFPKSIWGVAFIVLTDYMTFTESVSKTVISASIVELNIKSPRLNKTANECTKEELLSEILYQFQSIFEENGYIISQPTVSLLSPGIYYNKSIRKWECIDTAFISSNKYTPLPFKSPIISNLYNLGTHNGNSLYKFTSLESAVSNAVILAKELQPENDFIIPKNVKAYSLTDVSKIVFYVIIILFLYYKISTNGNRIRGNFKINSTRIKYYK